MGGSKIRGESAQKNADIDELELKNYGKGKWFWQISCEFWNPDSPFADLQEGQRDLFGTITFLAFAGENWKLRIAAPYLVKACHGRLSLRQIWYCLKVLRERGFLKLVERNVKRGNLYIANPILMRNDAAATLRNYELASELVAKPKPSKDAPKAEPTRLEQLELARELARKGELSTEAGSTVSGDNLL